MANHGWPNQSGYQGGYGASPGGAPQAPWGGGMQPQGHRGPWGPQRCQACHRVAPTKHVTLRQNVGAVILRFPKTIQGALCRRCIDRHFWSMTTVTFFFGWWGIISFFYSLVSIPANVGEYLGSRSLPDGY